MKKRPLNYSPFAIRHSLAMALLVLLSTQAAVAQERPASFVDAATVVPGLVVDMRYAGAHNFVGRPIEGYQAPHCLLTREAADALAEVARDLAPHGLVIKVFDCYRPVRAVMNFVRWARDLKRSSGQGGVLSRRRQAHAVSRRLYRLAFRPFARLDHGPDAGARGRHRARHGHPFRLLQPEIMDRGLRASAPRRMPTACCLPRAMRRRGFRGYDKEWWHFTLRGEPFPDTYFDFPVQ